MLLDKDEVPESVSNTIVLKVSKSIVSCCEDTDDPNSFTWSHDEDGDGEGADCDETPFGEVTLSFANVTETSIDILYLSDVAIGGYQFRVNGVNLTDAYDTFDLIAFNESNGMVFGTDLSGNDLPSGEGTLLHLEFEAVDGGSDIFLTDIIVGDSSGGDQVASTSTSAEVPACWNYDGDSIADGYYNNSGNGGCDLYDSDDDNDGASDEVDSDDNNELICSDDDNDTCDDCSDGSYGLDSDGFDYDNDGICDLGDLDDDNDGASDEVDSDDNNEFVCNDDIEDPIHDPDYLSINEVNRIYYNNI